MNDRSATSPDQAGSLTGTASPGADGTFLVIGESLVDLIADSTPGTFTARPGGSPFNVAVGLARLDQRVSFVTQYGDDALGRILNATLTANGIQAKSSPHPTSIAIATPDPNGSASYDFRFEWRLSGDAVDLPTNAACLHTGSLASVVEPGRKAVLAAVQRARIAGLPVSFDPNIRQSLTPDRTAVRTAVEEIVAAATIVKTSIEDINWLYPEDDPIQRTHRWAADGSRLVVLTRGPLGSIGFTKRQRVAVQASPTRVADTVGAGDSFTAALLSHLATTGSLRSAANLTAARIRDALEFASRASAITCAHTGAHGPTLRDIQLAARPHRSRRRRESG